MSKLKKISGKECIKILCNKFGFEVIRQRGSHIILKKETIDGKLKLGTLKNILKLAKVKEEEFVQYQ
jgi:predicted RNA binding protein YcfA (HicA-like mRNA interferase family)